MNPGQTILSAYGSLVLTVISTDVAAGEAVCRIENDFCIGERKNMNLPGGELNFLYLVGPSVGEIFISVTYMYFLSFSCR